MQSVSVPASVSQDIRSLLHFANDFNIGVCQLKLFTLLDASQHQMLDSNTFREECTKVLVEEATLIFQSRPGIWLSLLSILPQSNAEMVLPLLVSIHATVLTRASFMHSAC